MDNSRFYDAIIIGAGPAGLTAAIYLARARCRVLVIEKAQVGGQITITEEVVNYPGVEKTTGKELTATMKRQAEHFGAEFVESEVRSLETDGDFRKVITSTGEYSAFGVVIATGAHPRTIGFPGELEFRGRGVSYCATCDGEFFTGKEIFVIGGGYVSAEESVFLTKYASHVTILIRKNDFSCPAAIAEAAKTNPKITVLYNTQVSEVRGDTVLRAITYRNSVTGEEKTYAPAGDTFGLFVFAGYVPETGFVRDIVELDEAGYIVTSANGRTRVPGIYAAGDVCEKDLRQVVTAVGDGALAANDLIRYSASMQKKTGISAGKGKTEKTAEAAVKTPEVQESAYFKPEQLEKMKERFRELDASLVLELHLTDNAVSEKLKGYITDMCAMSPKLSCAVSGEGGEDLPFVKILASDGSYTGLAFHGVPEKHEFDSFLNGLVHASVPGKGLDEATVSRIRAIDHPVKIQVLVTLMCGICPELVTTVQRIAGLNPNISAEVYDLMKNMSYQRKYSVMSTPCLVINDGESVTFGNRTTEEILEMIG